MKHLIFLFLLSIISPGWASCSTDGSELLPEAEQPVGPDAPSAPDDNEEGNNSNNPMSNKLNISIGTSSFTVTLEDNATAKAFRNLLPLTLNMSDLNSNEKYYSLSANLPTAASGFGTIYTGDLMLYGSSTLVLFYETFSSSYSYTRIGRIDNPSGLANALGSGRVTVTFEIVNDTTHRSL